MVVSNFVPLRHIIIIANINRNWAGWVTIHPIAHQGKYTHKSSDLRHTRRPRRLYQLPHLGPPSSISRFRRHLHRMVSLASNLHRTGHCVSAQCHQPASLTMVSKIRSLHVLLHLSHLLDLVPYPSASNRRFPIRSRRLQTFLQWNQLWS